jgi:beta-phosphoglucomutase
MIKAILFDMDGVLIDAKDWHYDALNMALELFGYAISRDAHLTTFDGLPTRKKLQMLTASRGLPEGLHNFLNTLKQSHTTTIMQQKCKPTFNHQYAISRLKADGKLLGVCSNSVRQTVVSMMKLSKLERYLDVIYSNEDVAAGKPDPEMYLSAMNDLGVSPDETLILEDNDHGIEAAILSGAHLLKVGVPSDVTYTAICSRIHEIQSGA